MWQWIRGKRVIRVSDEINYISADLAAFGAPSECGAIAFRGINENAVWNPNTTTTRLVRPRRYTVIGQKPALNWRAHYTRVNAYDWSADPA